MLKLSEIIDKFNRLFKKKYKRYHLFEDKVYIYQRYVISFYVSYVIKRKKKFNKKMSSVRVIIKYDFEHI